ncbi:MAG: DUF6120 family protein [Clostridiales bacterium]|nr:DUF6120 family protein [Clostridiales bacterium]
MNKNCKEYISQVKLLFPIMGKREKKYIDDLSINLQDSFDESVSLEDIYESFGTPEETVNLYFSNTDMNYIIKRIRRSRMIKGCLAAISIVIIITLILFNIYIYEEHQIFKREEMINIETTIE